MFDVNFSEMMVIAIVAFIVIGPERLPKVARTLGHLVGRGQRYISSVKADIERDFAIEELRKLQEKVQSDYKAAEGAVSQATQTLNMHAQDFTQSVTQQVEQVREGIIQQSQINLDKQSEQENLFPKADPKDYVLQPLNREPTKEELEHKAVAMSYQEATRNLHAQQEEAAANRAGSSALRAECRNKDQRPRRITRQCSRVTQKPIIPGTYPHHPVCSRSSPVCRLLPSIRNFPLINEH